MSVLILTSVGEFTVDLYTEERPKCCENFLKLCKTKYYNYCLFHSIQVDLVAQSGDPTGSGNGGESVWGKRFMQELKPNIKHHSPGLISMVNDGNGFHGSQFFLTLGGDLDYLDKVHTVFGEVSENREILSKLNSAFVDKQHRPYQDIRIYHTSVLDDPFPDPEWLVIPAESPEPRPDQLVSEGRIGAEEVLDETASLSHAELEELCQQRQARTNANVLTMLGDLPDADIAPPENVLFVCRLNSVTTDEDLEIIFSKFGEIRSCDVIRDWKTGDSLQYAFIEFSQKRHCEEAYLNMNNVLIDDRRIHVDFSQSVSRKWNNFRRERDRKERGGASRAPPPPRPQLKMMTVKKSNAIVKENSNVEKTEKADRNGMGDVNYTHRNSRNNVQENSDRIEQKNREEARSQRHRWRESSANDHDKKSSSKHRHKKSTSKNHHHRRDHQNSFSNNHRNDDAKLKKHRHRSRS